MIIRLDKSNHRNFSFCCGLFVLAFHIQFWLFFKRFFPFLPAATSAGNLLNIKPFDNFLHHSAFASCFRFLFYPAFGNLVWVFLLIRCSNRFENGFCYRLWVSSEEPFDSSERIITGSFSIFMRNHPFCFIFNITFVVISL